MATVAVDRRTREPYFRAYGGGARSRHQGLEVSRQNYFYSLLDARYRELIAKRALGDAKRSGTKRK